MGKRKNLREKWKLRFKRKAFSDVRMNFHIGFIVALVVVFAQFVRDFLEQIYHYPYAWIASPLLVATFVIVIDLYLIYHMED